MLQRVKSKLADIGVIKFLSETAEAYALQDQQREPGAEHLLLAALDLPDGAARRAFEQAGASPDGLKAAIQKQYDDGLGSLGLKADSPLSTPMTANAGVYRAAASGQDVMQKLAALKKGRTPLNGAHVVSVIAGLSEGVAARALRILDVDLSRLKAAADDVSAANRAG
jgi:ATP-dependent Clp protease ATP-binding subunit ClpA